MRTNIRQRDVSFYVQDGCLVRTVTGGSGDGRSYCHRCTERNFETLAHAVEETPANGEGTTANFLSSLIGSLPAMHELAQQAGVELPAVLGRIRDEMPGSMAKKPNGGRRAAKAPATTA